MTDTIDLVVRRATPDDRRTVLAVLDEAAAWLAARGVVQWPARFRPEWIEPGLGSGEVWLAERAGVAVGTFTLQWSDPLWPDDGRAGYVHRLAVRRSAGGSGRWLLDRAADSAREHGRDLLRLDCDAGNPALRRYYESAGFRHSGDVEIPVAELKWSSGRLVVSRYERPVEMPANPRPCP
jgi:GNAT superfamily N-acetyltransferase